MKFVIWGSGKCGEKVYTLLGNDLIAAFIDSQTSKHGKYYLGKPILAFEEYRKSFADYEIIVALFSYEQAEQVVHMLSMYGITSYSAIVDLPFELLQLKDENLCVLLQKIPYKNVTRIYGNNLYAKIVSYILKVNCNVQVQCIDESKKISDDDVVLCCTKEKICNYDAFHVDIIDAWNIYKYSRLCQANELSKFQGIHKNERCVVVATGPSLSVNDLDKLKKSGIKTFGVNNVYKCFDKTKWRPDYYVVSDCNCLSIYGEEIMQSDLKNLFLLNQLDNIIRDDVYRYQLWLDVGHSGLLHFSSDVTQGAYSNYSGGTVVYVCLQIAIYMGFSEIYLIGADCSYDYNGKHHFIDNYYDDNDNYQLRKFNYSGVFLEYQSAKYYAEQHGIKIYNATRGGKLEIFERVDLDGLFYGNQNGGNI